MGYGRICRDRDHPRNERAARRLPTGWRSTPRRNTGPSPPTATCSSPSTEPDEPVLSPAAPAAGDFSNSAAVNTCHTDKTNAMRALDRRAQAEYIRAHISAGGQNAVPRGRSLRRGSGGNARHTCRAGVQDPRDRGQEPRALRVRHPRRGASSTSKRRRAPSARNPWRWCSPESFFPSRATCTAAAPLSGMKKQFVTVVDESVALPPDIPFQRGTHRRTDRNLARRTCARPALHHGGSRQGPLTGSPFQTQFPHSRPRAVCRTSAGAARTRDRLPSRFRARGAPLFFAKPRPHTLRIRAPHAFNSC